MEQNMNKYLFLLFSFGGMALGQGTYNFSKLQELYVKSLKKVSRKLVIEAGKNKTIKGNLFSYDLLRRVNGRSLEVCEQRKKGRFQ